MLEKQNKVVSRITEISECNLCVEHWTIVSRQYKEDGQKIEGNSFVVGSGASVCHDIKSFRRPLLSLNLGTIHWFYGRDLLLIMRESGLCVFEAVWQQMRLI